MGSSLTGSSLPTINKPARGVRKRRVAGFIIASLMTAAGYPWAVHTYDRSKWGGYYAKENRPPNIRQPGKPLVVVLGDSLLAAPGARSGMYRDTIEEDTGFGCRQSEFSPAYFVAKSLSADIELHACTGSTSKEVESYQLPQASRSAELVLVSMGANNEGFTLPRLIASCVTGRFSQRTCMPEINTAKRRIDEVTSQVQKSLEKIKKAYPESLVVYIYYPDSLPLQDDPLCGFSSAMELHNARQVQDDIRASFHKAVNEADVEFFDPFGALTENEKSCGKDSVFQDLSFKNAWLMWPSLRDSHWVHLNKQGNEILGQRITDFVRESIGDETLKAGWNYGMGNREISLQLSGR